MPFCYAQDVSWHLPCIQSCMLLSHSSQGVFSLLQQSCHPATPSRCSLGPWLPAEHHLFLVPGQASSWQSPLAQSGRELYHSACVGQSPAHSSCRSPWALHPASSAVCGEPWLIVEQEHVLQMPPYSDVQAALQGRDPHRFFGCSHFPVSPVLCSGG